MHTQGHPNRASVRCVFCSLYFLFTGNYCRLQLFVRQRWLPLGNSNKVLELCCTSFAAVLAGFYPHYGEKLQCAISTSHFLLFFPFEELVRVHLLAGLLGVMLTFVPSHLLSVM